MEQVVTFRFTETELKYLNNLSEVTGMSKKIIIEKLIRWINKNPYKSQTLDFTSDYDDNNNQWKILNIRCQHEITDMLKQQSNQINVSRYELVRALIKKVPELLKTGELFDYNSLYFENFKRKDN